MGRERHRKRAAPSAARLRFLEDVVAGLSLPQKAIPPKYFYDAAGSRLFEAICRLPEYYLTRAELQLTRTHLADIVRFAGRGCELVEFGSGEGVKTRLLVGRLQPARYVPVEISAVALRDAVRRLQRAFPGLEIAPLEADFMRFPGLPLPARGRRRVVYFPGSTIGNLDRDEAQALLGMTRGQVGARGAMLVGVDLKKDAGVLHAAYNDARGVTAAFNLNLLKRINRELGGDFVPRRFAHYAFYNAPLGRIEMHLVSQVRQSVRVAGHRFGFEPGETIHTENSYKYGGAEFARLAARAGFAVRRTWMDAGKRFALFGLAAA